MYTGNTSCWLTVARFTIKLIQGKYRYTRKPTVFLIPQDNQLIPYTTNCRRNVKKSLYFDTTTTTLRSLTVSLTFFIIFGTTITTINETALPSIRQNETISRRQDSFPKARVPVSLSKLIRSDFVTKRIEAIFKPRRSNFATKRIKLLRRYVLQPYRAPRHIIKLIEISSRRTFSRRRQKDNFLIVSITKKTKR